MDYRAEIDGLRSLAVLPVVFFHAGFHTFRGGFVGVDIFFVISGYLITSIILAELAQGNFSIANFYERRLRRIFPALFFVMLACIPFACFWLTPSDMKNFFKSLIAVSSFVSNILFLKESGYFDTSSELKPLLHTWSLALEEQYYLLFPLYLMLFSKLGKHWILLSLSLALVASLVFSQYLVNENPAYAFFLLPSRGWELLIGGLSAYYLSNNQHSCFSMPTRNIAAWLGVVLIFYSVFSYSKTSPFPGLYALIPTLGAALIIIFATSQNSVGQFLGHRVLVGLGMISYSAYLWHQPLFAFARQRSLIEPSHTLFFILVIVTLILAYFTWRFIELPFRRRDCLDRGKVLSLALIASFIAISLGILGVHGKIQLTNDASISLGKQLDSRLGANHGLSQDCDKAFNSSPHCSTSAEPEILLWGDSYAMHLAQGLIASNPKIKMVQKTVSSCGPFFGIAPLNNQLVQTWSKKCLEFNDEVFQYLKDKKSIKYVVLSSPFRHFVDAEAHVLTHEGQILNANTVALLFMLDTLSKLRAMGKIPVIFAPTPQNGENIGNCLKKAKFFNQDIAICNIKLSESLLRQADVWRFLNNLKMYVTIIHPSDFLCHGNHCLTSIDDVFIYRDHGHLSKEGSAYLGKQFNFYRLVIQAQ